MTAEISNEAATQRLPFRYAVPLLLVVHIVLISWWYITLPHERPVSHYIPGVWHAINGLILGLYGRQSLPRDAIVMTLVETVLTTGIHFLANTMGKHVDFATIHAWPVFLLVALLNTLFALSGSLLGWNLRPRRKTRKAALDHS
ncbi:hypothetical protein EGT07_20760 [Herbaspirillum sp. HC18]|nr:hypothetical protein EGT07_20760 [Herbaspirillum sp. HC18]